MNPKAAAVLVFFSVACIAFAIMGWGPALIVALTAFSIYVIYALI